MKKKKMMNGMRRENKAERREKNLLKHQEVSSDLSSFF
jgi:hypothetical protein